MNNSDNQTKQDTDYLPHEDQNPIGLNTAQKADAEENLIEKIKSKMPQPEVIDESLTDIALRRKKEIEKKKRVFDKIFLVVKIITFTMLFGAIIFFIIRSRQPVVPIAPINIINSTTEPGKPVTKMTLYEDKGLKIFIKYPEESSIYRSEEPSNKLEIKYEKDNQKLEELNERNLSQGYIVRISPLNISIRDLNKIAGVKHESYKRDCPQGASIGAISTTKVDGVDARTFEVFNCDSDYRVTYVPRFGIYYEIAQIYKGDIGVKQKFKSMTDEIYLSFRFFPEDTPIPEPFTLYTNKQYLFNFKHPNLDTGESCCEIQEPPIGRGRYILFLYDKYTYIDSKNYDGFALYAYYNDKADFGSFIENQKNVLIEDYKVVTGGNPVTYETEIPIGGQTAIRLDGYSWKGYSFIYLPKPNSDEILFFSIKNTSGDSFEQTLMEIINSFEFYQ